VIAVVGVGLIGGSFALAMREAGYPGPIVGVSSPQTLETAIGLGVIDEGLPLNEACAEADLVYLATPISKIIELLTEIDHFVRPGALITDAGSTKAAIAEQAARHIKRGRFVGGHPMAGKETHGVQSAEAGLFRERPYVLTSPDAQLEEWVHGIGARLVHLSPEEHDRRVALISHLPQLMSTAFASLVTDEAAVAGPAARDFSRLALSTYEIWKDIIETNEMEIDRVLGLFEQQIATLRRKIRDGEDLSAAFEKAAEGAKAIRQVGQR
jgi:prephenate dehydrogenase